ncbi:hypothetical protein EJ03DRAFT_258245, partial [Teratosphaeria nubilosa]
HEDSMLTSYLLQVSEQWGLQPRNVQGEWIDCALVFGATSPSWTLAPCRYCTRAEASADGVRASTTHRGLSPGKGWGARFSIP